MGKKLTIDLKYLSNELDRSIKSANDYRNKGDEVLLAMYQARIDALTWVIRIGD